MSLALLGEGFELHGGGLDLVFPHHENERAQAVALGRTFARHWVHNGLVMVDGEKMSKSLGNYIELATLLEEHDPRAYRLLVLRSHYRSPLEVGDATLADAEAALGRIDELARRMSGITAPGGTGALRQAEIAMFREAMDDDLATPRALAGVLTAVRRANSSLDAGDSSSAIELANVALELLGVLGLEPRTASDAPTAEVEALASARQAARSSGDYAAADALRGQIEALGWKVEDSSTGPRLHR